MQKRKKIELPNSGDIFGSLTLTGNYEYVQTSDGKRLFAEAKCVCGDIRGYALRHLLRENTKSCGCIRRQKLLESRITHNLSKHPLYKCYQDMVRRCYKTNCKAYPDYGGRGIKVCDKWLNDVKSFCDWGMANGWQEGLELDRKENEGIYEPSNCHFVTREIGNKNTRRNIILTAFGETKCAADWLRDKRCKIKGNTLKMRLGMGWEIEKALTTPPNAFKKEISQNISTVRMITAFGETKCISAWSEDKRCKIGYSGLKIRLKKGWEPEQAISAPFRAEI